MMLLRCCCTRTPLCRCTGRTDCPKHPFLAAMLKTNLRRASAKHSWPSRHERRNQASPPPLLPQEQRPVCTPPLTRALPPREVSSRALNLLKVALQQPMLSRPSTRAGRLGKSPVARRGMIPWPSTTRPPQRLQVLAVKGHLTTAQTGSTVVSASHGII